MRWMPANSNSETVSSLQAKGLPRHVAILLANRGIDAGSADAFLNPRLNLMSSPWLLQDMDKAASLVADAIR